MPTKEVKNKIKDLHKAWHMALECLYEISERDSAINDKSFLIRWSICIDLLEKNSSIYMLGVNSNSYFSKIEENFELFYQKNSRYFHDRKFDYLLKEKSLMSLLILGSNKIDLRKKMLKQAQKAGFDFNDDIQFLGGLANNCTKPVLMCLYQQCEWACQWLVQNSALSEMSEVQRLELLKRLDEMRQYQSFGKISEKSISYIESALLTESVVPGVNQQNRRTFKV